MPVSSLLLGSAYALLRTGKYSPNWFWIVVIVVAVAFVLWLVGRGRWNDRDRMR